MACRGYAHERYNCSCSALCSSVPSRCRLCASQVSPLHDSYNLSSRSSPLSPDGPNASLSCAAEFSLWGRHCYRFSGHSVRRTFHHAERHCGRMLATLASLHSTEEERFALQLTRNGTAIWIGLSDEGSGGSSGRKFRWTDGTALSLHIRWRAGEPGGSSHLHCTQADQRGWALASGGCSSTRLPFVCKRRGMCKQRAYNYYYFLFYFILFFPQKDNNIYMHNRLQNRY